MFLDDALTRPGRLGFAVGLDGPDEDERVELFELFARGRPIDGVIDWRRLGQLSRGHTPAGLRQALDDALGLALSDGREVIRESDVLDALRRGGRVVPEVNLQEDDLRRICAQEAGHVAVAVALMGADWVHAVDISEAASRMSATSTTRLSPCPMRWSGHRGCPPAGQPSRSDRRDVMHSRRR